MSRPRTKSRKKIGDGEIGWGCVLPIAFEHFASNLLSCEDQKVVVVNITIREELDPRLRGDDNLAFCGCLYFDAKRSFAMG